MRWKWRENTCLKNWIEEHTEEKEKRSRKTSKGLVIYQSFTQMTSKICLKLSKVFINFQKEQPGILSKIYCEKTRIHSMTLVHLMKLLNEIQTTVPTSFPIPTKREKISFLSVILHGPDSMDATENIKSSSASSCRPKKEDSGES